MKAITKIGYSAPMRMWRLLCLAVLAFGLLFLGEAQAGQSRPFTNASLYGQYALVGTGGDHAAASIGIENYDGQGGVTRFLILNELDQEGKRKVIRISGQGTYSVQSNGMGQATIINTLPNGSSFTSHLDFVITQAGAAGPKGVKLATEVHSILREPGIAAPLVVFKLTRLPE